MMSAIFSLVHPPPRCPRAVAQHVKVIDEHSEPGHFLYARDTSTEGGCVEI